METKSKEQRKKELTKRLQKLFEENNNDKGKVIPIFKDEKA